VPKSLFGGRLMPSAGIHSDHHLCGPSHARVARPRPFTRAQTTIREMTPMKLPRRNFLHLAAGAVALSAVSRIACDPPPLKWSDLNYVF
jgi:hypothetical protein